MHVIHRIHVGKADIHIKKKKSLPKGRRRRISTFSDQSQEQPDLQVWTHMFRRQFHHKPNLSPWHLESFVTGWPLLALLSVIVLWWTCFCLWTSFLMFPLSLPSFPSTHASWFLFLPKFWPVRFTLSPWQGSSGFSSLPVSLLELPVGPFATLNRMG